MQRSFKRSLSDRSAARKDGGCAEIHGPARNFTFEIESFRKDPPVTAVILQAPMSQRTVAGRSQRP